MTTCPSSNTATPTIVHSAVPVALVRHLHPNRIWKLVRINRDLIFQFAQREMIERHHGAALGMAWNVINPLLSLIVYTFVFGVVLGVKWPTEVNRTGMPFAMILVTGQMMFHIFSECANRAPTLITSRRSFVRKVIFPIEILPIAAVASTLLHLIVMTCLILIGTIIAGHGLGGLSRTAWLFPIVCVPLYLGSLGVSWFLAALGVFLQDIRNIVSVLTMLLMFCSGVFYPTSHVPERIRWLVEYNPMHVLIDSARQTLLWSSQPDWPKLTVITIGAFMLMQAGYAFFVKSKRGMADVV